MGEYAKYAGSEIKIGTCEDMYYLRADQRHMVTPLDNNVNPEADKAEIRFRFPFPDEDGTEPGRFENAFRTVSLYDVEPIDGLEHGKVQFCAQKGYLVSLPCPESPEGRASGLPIHRNGFAGPVAFGQQKWFGGKWILIGECGGCGHKYRYETLETVQPILDALDRYATASARTNDEHRAVWYRSIADRILRGYISA